MTIEVCIGSSCHLKGSRNIVLALSELIEKNNLKDKVSLKGTFCMGKCQTGVNVKIENSIFSVSPDNVLEFFNNEVLTRI